MWLIYILYSLLIGDVILEALGKVFHDLRNLVRLGDRIIPDTPRLEALLARPNILLFLKVSHLVWCCTSAYHVS